MKHLIVQDSHSVISHPALNKEMFEEEKNVKHWHLTPSM